MSKVKSFHLFFMLLCCSLCYAQQTSNYVVITITPEKATVLIDSTKLETDNGLLHYLLPIGIHKFEISAPRHQSVEGEFEISPSKRTEINISLLPSQPRLHIRSHDNNASLFLDGKSLQGSDWIDFISSGRHIVRAEKDGFKPYEEIVTVDSGDGGKLYTVEIPPLKKTTGSINFNIQPVNANVYIDGAYIGQTPMVVNNLEIGKYKVEIKKDGYVEFSKNINVKDGRQADINGSLVPFECVDLGLNAKWATFNVGASAPLEEGIKLCWGSTSPSSDESPEMKYVSFTGSKKTNTTQLYSTPANILWGSDWTMPTYEDFHELMIKCKWAACVINNVTCVKITGPNGNYIIMPLGSYWASNRNPRWSESKTEAYALQIYEDYDKPIIHVRLGSYAGDIYYDNSDSWFRGGFADDGLYINRKNMIRAIKH